MFGHLHRLRDGAGDYFDLFLQTLQRPDRHVVARHDPLGVEQLRQRRHDGVTTILHPGGEQLDGEVIPIFIHHESRQKIRLAIDHPIVILTGADQLPVVVSLTDPLNKKVGAVDILPTPGENSDGDERAGVVVAGPQKSTTGVEQLRGATRLTLPRNLLDLVAEDPGVSLPQSPLLTLLQTDT